MYKTKNLLRRFGAKPPIAGKPPTALPGSRGPPRMMSGAQSVGAGAFKVMPASAKDGALRPTTAVTFGMSDAPTAESNNMISA